MRHCQRTGSSNSFDTVLLYHTVSRAGKHYLTGFYESVLILTVRASQQGNDNAVVDNNKESLAHKPYFDCQL